VLGGLSPTGERRILRRFAASLQDEEFTSRIAPETFGHHISIDISPSSFTISSFARDAALDLNHLVR